MTEIQKIDKKISDLKTSLENVTGTSTEVYTRIVGYYRSVKNWNAGKRAELNERVTFDNDLLQETLNSL